MLVKCKYKKSRLIKLKERKCQMKLNITSQEENNDFISIFYTPSHTLSFCYFQPPENQ